jgi:uncharacterized protein YbjT (DUF2867 family)
MGSRLIPLLCRRGHQVVALAREQSKGKVPPGCAVVTGDALVGESYAAFLDGADTFVQLVGVSHPSPAKAQQFVDIDQRSALEAVRVAAQKRVGHFVYVSVAHPAPAMHAYVAARTRCEEEIRKSGLNATILRPWYVLGPGHRWPYALLPFYKIAEIVPGTRDGARRLGLVTLHDMLRALVHAVEHPASSIRIIEVPEIRRL